MMKKISLTGGNEETKIPCHADDVVPIAENEDDLQRLISSISGENIARPKKLDA